MSGMVGKSYCTIIVKLSITAGCNGYANRQEMLDYSDQISQCLLSYGESMVSCYKVVVSCC